MANMFGDIDIQVVNWGHQLSVNSDHAPTNHISDINEHLMLLLCLMLLPLEYNK